MSFEKENRLLNYGVLGCGPIAQYGHLDAVRKTRNGHLYAICDANRELADRVALVHKPEKTYYDYESMLGDSSVESVVIATSDYFHVPLARQAVAAGKHVFVEKPLGVRIEECETLAREVEASGLVLQVGNNRRFDPGMEYAHRFIEEEIGELMAIKVWYCDSIYRYTMTDNLFPPLIEVGTSKKPAIDEKANRERYFMLAHGSHITDTARFLAGDIETVTARLIKRFGQYCWFVLADFTSGITGHLDLTIKIAGDYEEGFRVYGENGSINGKAALPWFHKSSQVECFSTKDGMYHRPLGEDGYTYRRQLEGFGDTILHGKPMVGATVYDGLEAFRTMVAISESVKTGKPAQVKTMKGELR